MFYVVNRRDWPLRERARKFADFDSATYYIDRRARYVLALYGESAAERFVRDTVIYTSTRRYLASVFRHGGFILLLFFLIFLAAAWLTW